MEKYIKKYMFRTSKFTFRSYGIHATKDGNNLIIAFSFGFYTFYLSIEFNQSDLLEDEDDFICVKKARLEDWDIVKFGENRFYLVGIVYNHPKLADGTRVSTSEVIEMNNDFSAKTMNTDYSLGVKRFNDIKDNEGD